MESYKDRRDQVQLDRTEGQSDTHRIALRSPAHHRAHRTKRHKRKSLKPSDFWDAELSMITAETVSGSSDLRFRCDYITHAGCFWRMILLSCWGSRHRGAHSSVSWDLKPPRSPACPLNHCDVIDRLQSRWSQNNSCLPYIVKVVERYCAQMFWFQKSLQTTLSKVKMLIYSSLVLRT